MGVLGCWWGEDEEFVGDDLKVGGKATQDEAQMRVWCAMENMLYFYTKVGCSDRPEEREKGSKI